MLSNSKLLIPKIKSSQCPTTPQQHLTSSSNSLAINTAAPVKNSVASVKTFAAPVKNSTTSTKCSAGNFLKNPKLLKNSSNVPVLQKSIYDWDSPSSSTGTIKKRPSSIVSPTSPTNPINKTDQISSKDLNLKLSPHHKKIPTTATKSTKENSQLLSTIKSSSSEFLLENNLKGRTKNLKLQKFNQNNKLQQKRQQQQKQQQNIQQKSSTSRSEDVSNKKFIKNNIKTVTVDNDIVVNVDNNGDNNDTVIIDNDDNVENVDNVIVSSNKEKTNVLPKGISPSSSLNGSIKNEQQQQQQHQKKNKFSTRTKISSLTNSKNNSFCKQKSKQFPLATTTTTNVTIPNVSTKLLKPKKLPKNKEKTNGDRNVKEIEITLNPSLQKTKTTTVTNKTTTATTKTTTADEEKLIKNESIDTKQSENNLKYSKPSLKNENGELKTVEVLQKISKKTNSLESILNDCSIKDNKNYGKIEINIDNCTATNDGTFLIENQKTEYCDITNTTSASNIPTNQFNSPPGSSRTIDCISPTPIASSSPSNQIPIQNQTKMIKLQPPPYRHPPQPPTPPPISQIPSLNKNHSNTLNEVPNNRKTHPKQKSPEKSTQNPGQAIKLNSSPTHKASHFNELKNCFSKLNSKFSFTSALSRVHLIQSDDQNSNNDITKQNIKQQQKQHLNEYSGIFSHTSTKEINKISPDDLKILNRPKFTSNQFKNIPVRQRKGPQISHLENYCLFDPSVDFINEKEQSTTNCLTLEETKNQSNQIDSKNHQNQNLNEGNALNSNFTDDTGNFQNKLILNKESANDDIKDDDNDSKNDNRDNRINEMQHHNYFTIDPKTFQTDSTSTVANSNRNPISTASIKEHLQNIHVQNQFSSRRYCNDSNIDIVDVKDKQSTLPPTASNKRRVDFSNSSNVDDVADIDDDDNKHTHSIQITVNKDIILKNLQNEHSKAQQKQHQQQQQQYKHYQQEQHLNDCTIKKGVDEIAQHNFSIHPMANVGHKMTIEEQKRILLHQHQEIPLNILLVNSKYNGVEHEEKEGQQKDQLEEQQKSKNISINSCHQHYHHYYNQNHHYQQQQQQLQQQNQYENKIFVDSAHHQLSNTTTTTLNNSKIHLNNNGSIKWITGKLENGNNSIKPEVNKCLSTLNNCKYTNSNSINILSKQKAIHQLRHSMDEIFSYSNSTLLTPDINLTAPIVNNSYKKPPQLPLGHDDAMQLFYTSELNLFNSIQGHSEFESDGKLNFPRKSNIQYKYGFESGYLGQIGGYKIFRSYNNQNQNHHPNKKTSRPLSIANNSDDCDSGFLSPNSPDYELKFNSDIFWDKIQKQIIFWDKDESYDNVQGYIEIYTDWANYYLDRAKSKKRIIDLANDCCDGLLLADIIEIVTNFKVPNIIKNPKNHQQMHDNVLSCLTTLRTNSIDGTENITAHDICSGHLKAILTLFFALSRHKQQLKQKQKSLINSTTPIVELNNQISPTNNYIDYNNYVNYNENFQQQQRQKPQSENHNNHQQQHIKQQNKQQQYVEDVNNLLNDNNMETIRSNWQKSSPYSKTNGTAIPLPATVLVQRRCPPDKVRPLPPTPNHVPSIPGLGKTGNSGSSSVNNSPINSHSHISLQSSPQKVAGNNGIRPPQCKIPSSPFTSPKMSGHSTITTTPSHTTSNISSSSSSDKPPPLPAANPPPPASKHSMLDKFKLFKTEKSTSSSNSSTKSERTSSSSGFSSARSEKSDSSSSLNHLPPVSTKLKPPSKGSIISSNDNSRIKESISKKTTKQSSNSDKISTKQSKDKSPAKSSSGKDEKTATKLQKSTLKNSNADQGKSSSKTSTSDQNSKTSGEKKINNGMVRSNSSNLSLNNTGIPKPMAAIKGQTKTVHINGEEKLITIVKDNSQKDISKSNCDSVGAISSQHSNTNSEQTKTHIVRPLPTHPHQHNGLNLTNGLTSCLKPTPIINGILKHAEMEKNSSNSALVNVKNLKLNGIDPQTFNEQNNGNKSANTNRSPNKNGTVNNGIGNSVQNSDLFEEEQPVNVTPMKPLLEGYNSHVTILPSRSNQKVQYLITEYGDIDLGQGYMSDGGESFRRVPVLTQRFLEIDNGYLSDGSVGSLSNQQQQQMQQQQQQPLTPHRGKHFLNGLRGRQLLPTTIIEERVRGSRGSLDSIGGTGTQTLNSPTGSQQNTITNNNYNNNNNNTISECTSDNNSPKNNTNNNQINSDSDSPTNMESKCDSNPNSRSSSRIGFVNGRDTNNQKLLINGSTDQQQQQQLNKLPTGELNTNQKIKSSQNKQSSSPSKTKGVPQSFGYIKRTNGSALGVVTTPASTILTAEQQKMIQQQQQLQQQQQQLQQQQQQQDLNRSTAHVSGVPRNGKIKISGGTQTPQNDIQTKMPPTNQNRSFSLTGPGATQLSQAIRERLANGSYSLPKPGTEMHMFQHRVKYRHSGKILDGSLSDTQTYAEVKPEQSSYAMWLKHSNTTSSRLSAGDSIESLQHVLGSPAMQRHSAHKLIHRNSPSNQMLSNGQIVEAVYVQSPRLNRSNSIRSSKSDKMYSTLSSNQSGEVDAEPFYCLPVGSIQSQLQNGIIGGGNLVKIAPWSQPTSPTPPTGRAGLLSPTHSGISSSGYNSITPSHRLTYPKRNDDVHGSTASLLSGGSSLYGSVEERQANEVRRLKRELIEAKEQVMSLSSQLSTNAHVVSAFEQSLSNMKQRLHQLTETTERKDGELTDMRQTIELLRKQSIQAGLTSAHMQSMGLPSSQTNDEQTTISPRKQNCSENLELKKATANGGTNLSNTNRDSATSNLLEVPENQTSRGSICSLNSITSVNSTNQDKKKKKSWLKSSFTKAFSKNAKISKTDKHASSSIPNTPQKVLQQRNLDATNLLQKQILAAGGGLTEDPNHFLTGTNHNMETNRTSTDSTKSSPQKCVTIIENAKPLDAIDLDGNPVVEDLKKQLREKDLILTDIRLEALSSASQLENLRDTVMKMRAEMLSLKQNNDRLQKLVTSRSLAGSEISLRNSISPNGSIISDSKRYSLVDGTRPHIELPKSLEEEVEEDNLPPAPAPEPPPPTTLPIQTTSPTTHIDLTPPPPAIEAPSPTRSQPPMLPSVSEDVPDVTDGKKIEIAVYLGQPESFSKYLEEIIGNTEAIYSNTNFHKEHQEAEEIYSNATTEMDERMYSNPNFHEFVIACTYISGKTTWQNLDYIVRKTFKDYLARIDPGTNLGLNTDSITSYHLGEAKRGPEIGFPQLLPCGYIIGTVKTLYICLQGVGSLAFDSLIPRSIVHRYITLLTEHRRLILCGPSGTGKSYLARKLAEFIVARGGRNNISEAIATFNVDNKSSKELRQFLSYIGEQASMPNGESELPSVIILDNLHQASALGDVFSSLLSAGPAAKLPCIIGTMSQATCNTTNLQLHHNFRWVLTANHMEPVKGFLGRYLKRRLYTLELHSQNHQPDLTAVFAWLPTVWQHINRFLEIHSSSDVTIGPRLFLSCPLNLKDSQVWFTDIWNYHIVPYLIEAVREGVQLYGRRGGAWNDPSTFIRDTYPWKYGPDSVPPLRQINAEDVGLEGSEIGKSDSHDPLLNMLMHLQEAANYSENQEPESDCVSLDSNLTQDSSVGVENDVE